MRVRIHMKELGFQCGEGIGQGLERAPASPRHAYPNSINPFARLASAITPAVVDTHRIYGLLGRPMFKLNRTSTCRKITAMPDGLPCSAAVSRRSPSSRMRYEEGAPDRHAARSH